MNEDQAPVEWLDHPENNSRFRYRRGECVRSRLDSWRGGIVEQGEITGDGRIIHGLRRVDGSSCWEFEEYLERRNPISDAVTGAFGRSGAV